jgi:hypothetical protein
MPKLSHEDQELITAYLQNELTDEALELFQRKTNTSSAFKYVVEQQQALISQVPLGYQEHIDEQRMQSLRWQTKAAISRANRDVGIGQWVNQALNFSVPLKVQLASMLIMFWLGFQLNSGDLGDSIEPSLIADTNGQGVDLVTVNLIEKDEFEITDFQIHQLDLDKKTISFDYSVASTKRLSGGINDTKVKSLIASALKNHVSDATRIDLVELSQHQQPSSSITNALSYSLLNDPNPGVRMAAAETLGKINHSDDVKQVLIAALQKEVNPGIRVEAFNALRTYKADEDIQSLFRDISKTDSNTYIRQQSSHLLKESNTI